MDRPRRRWVRTLTIVIGGAAGTIALFGVPAGAAGATSGTVAASDGLIVRDGPTRSATRKGIVPNGTNLAIVCQATGEQIAGDIRDTNAWNRLSNGWYVSDAYVVRETTPQTCAEADRVRVQAQANTNEDADGDQTTAVAAAAVQPRPAAPVAGDTAVTRWMAPVKEKVTSGFRTASRPGHDGVDLPSPKNTPIYAPASGTVLQVVCNTSNGSCDVDGSMAVQGCGWYLEIKHTNQMVTRYCHLNRRPAVAVGQTVTAGQVIGVVGSSGNSSGPHLHFEVHTRAPATSANAIDPVVFMKKMGVNLT